ncbi:MAG: AAA family ATPase [Bacteroidetes bacterium]|nr:AAA family ATPase [Bacteroidota bacterium]
MRLYLIGYMGCGKSKIGNELATMMNYLFTDIDDLFEERYRISVLDFFSRFDETTFRKLEQQLLKQTISAENTVISAGGGTPCFFDNMEFIKRNGISFYLKPDNVTLIERLRHVKKKRPLITEIPSDDLEQFVTNQINEREAFYLQADYIIDGDDITAERILNVLNDQNKTKMLKNKPGR